METLSTNYSFTPLFLSISMNRFFDKYQSHHYFIEGGLTSFLGILLIIFGNRIPRLGYLSLCLFLFFNGLWHLLVRWFQAKENRENLLISLGKILAGGILFISLELQNLAIYFLVAIIAIYQLLTASISFITWQLYRQNKITPRLNYLFDSLWIGAFGLYSISPLHDASNFQLMLVGFYLILLGMTYMRDGLFNGKSGKRRLRVSLPIVISALIPISTLRQVNALLAKGNDDPKAQALATNPNHNKDNLEIFIHASESSIPLALGHVDICYKGQVISYGSYDKQSERLFGAIGDGILFKADRDQYLALCKAESQKTLFSYRLELTDEQEKAIKEQIEKIEQTLIPWEPSSDKITNEEGKKVHSYAYLLKTQASGQLYKFKGSKFKTYFVMSTNCVLLADSIIGRAGTDILSPQGFITPGTYQDYLDREYDNPNGLVVSKTIY